MKKLLILRNGILSWHINTLIEETIGALPTTTLRQMPSMSTFYTEKYWMGSKQTSMMTNLVKLHATHVLYNTRRRKKYYEYSSHRAAKTYSVNLFRFGIDRKRYSMNRLAILNDITKKAFSQCFLPVRLTPKYTSKHLRKEC